MTVSAVAFDLDGLMFNTEELYFDVGSEQLRRRGHKFTVELRDRMMGRPGAVALQMMIDHHGLADTIEQLIVESDEIFEGLLKTRLAPMPGLVELLALLETAKIPKAIATSSRRTFVDRVLSPFGWAGRFKFILTSESITHGKPHPEIYQTAAQRFGIQPANMLVFEDSANGCLAASAAGALVVAVPGDHSRAHDFRGAAFVAESLADPRILELIPAA